QVIAVPPPLRDTIPTLSAAVEEVVLTALAKDPKQRFATVHAFAVAFEQAIAHPGHSTISTPRSAPLSPVSTTTPTVIIPSGKPTAPLSPQASSTGLAPTEISPKQASAPRLSAPLTTAHPPTEPTSVPVVPEPSVRPRRSISRRVVLAGLVGLAGAGGALAW